MSDLSRAAERAAAHSAALALYARQWLDATAAQDVVQEALVRLLGQRVCPDEPVAWMYAAVRRAAIDAARSRDRRRKREGAMTETKPNWFQHDEGAALDADAAQRALTRLPHELREIVVLRIWAELGYADIARITGVSVGTAHARFIEAMRRLRDALDVTETGRSHDAGKRS
jgi:RNA polymerase sigma-70 factor (ECF subfamily)